jgi:ATP-dependent DNA ligase
MAGTAPGSCDRVRRIDVSESLRHAKFIALREDKDARAAVREAPANEALSQCVKGSP